jgi:hypothetical protein
MTPLRQFKGVPTEIIRKAEGKQFVSILLCLRKLQLTIFVLALASIL